MKLVYASLPLLQGASAAISTAYSTVAGTAPTNIANTDIKVSVESVTTADSAANAAVSALGGLTDGTLSACDTANAVGRPSFTQATMAAFISDLHMDYALGMIRVEDFDRTVTALKACATTNSIDVSTLDNGKAAVSVYSIAKPGMDWSELATITNPSDGTELLIAEFSTAQRKSYFNNMKVWTAKYVQGRNPTVGATGFAMAGTTFATSIDGTATVTDLTEFDTFVNKQLRLKALGDADENWSAVVTNKAALAADWFTGSSDAAAFIAIIDNLESMFNTWIGYQTSAETAYDTRSQFSPMYETLLNDQSTLFSSGNAQTTYESIATAMSGSSFMAADNWLLGMDGDTSCTNAMNLITKYTDVFGSAKHTLSQKLHNLVMLYAFRYLDSAHMDHELSAYDACFDASVSDVTTRNNYKAGIDAAKAGVTRLDTAMIDVDYGLETTLVNTGLTSTTKIVLSAAQDNEWFISSLIDVADKAMTYVTLDTAGTFDATDLDTTPLSAITTKTELLNTLTQQFRQYAISDVSDVTNTWVAQVYDSRTEIGTSVGLTSTGLTSFTTDMVNLKSQIDTIKARYLQSKTAYDIVTSSITPAAIGTVVASVHTANAAKFTDDTAATASYTSVGVAVTSIAPAVDYISQVMADGGTSMTTCQDRIRLTIGLDATHTYNHAADALYMYAFRYIRSTDLDLWISANTACINALNPSNAATLITAMSTAKANIVQYSGKIGLDWTLFTNSINTPSTIAVSLTTAETQSVYTGIRMGYASLAALTAYNDIPSSTQTVISTQMALAESLTAINALNTNDPTFAAIANYGYYTTIELREYAINKASDFESNFVNQAGAIADAYALTLTDKSAFETSIASTKTLTDTWKATSQSMEDNYNSGARFGFSLGLLLAFVAKYLLD